MKKILHRRPIALAVVASAVLHLAIVIALRSDYQGVGYKHKLILRKAPPLPRDSFRARPETPLTREGVRYATSPWQDLLSLEPPQDVVTDTVESLVPSVDEMPQPHLGARSEVFVPLAIDEDHLLGEREIEAVKKLRALYDGYARFWIPDSNLDEVARESRSRAEEIVARAFSAMGGLQRLLKISELQAIVWVIADDTVTRSGRVLNTSPYPFPVAVWHMSGLDRTDRSTFRIEANVSSVEEAPEYQRRNPSRARSLFYSAYESRWQLNAPPKTRRLRTVSETARWHFVDWFRGEGIRLRYMGTERLEAVDMGRIKSEPVHRIRVDDRKYGRILDAFFHLKTGLLVGTKEALLQKEAEWYFREYSRHPPVWSTRYGNYRVVEGGALLPHRWFRSTTAMGFGVDLRFSFGINGARADTVAPEL